MTTAPNSYGTVTKVFHWLTAVLIIALIPLGAIANRLPYDTNEQLAQKAWLFSVHKTLGVLVFAVALMRIVWALTHTKPGSLHPERKGETLLAETVHWLLYGSLVIVPLSGWIHHAATTGFAPIWWPFGQSLPLVPKDDGVAHLWGGLHWIMTKVLLVALLLHIAGALKHHFVDRDATLRRMWFGGGPHPDVAYHRAPITAPIVALAVFGLAAGTVIATEEADAAPVQLGTLEAVTSDWTVTDGTLAITVLQLGSEVTGSFADWTADITFDPDAAPDFGAVTVVVSIPSLTLGSVTDQAMGRDFFDAETFPTATFSGPITSDGGATYRVDGELTLKGVTAPVSLLFDLALDGDTAQMDGTATVERLAFNIGESMADETNLGFPVAINVDLTATRTQN